MVVVVTGASSGNGRAIAQAFAERGDSLVLVARREDALAEAAAECEKLGGPALPITADVCQTASVDEVARQAVERFGRIDVWVNNAAVLHFGRVDETPAEVIEQVLRTNVVGYFNGTRAAIRQFRQQGTGILINVSSALAITGQPFASAYVASKAAIRGLSNSVRQEMDDFPGIDVCVVLPYAIDTPIYQRAANYSGKVPQPVFPRYSPETVARTVTGLVDHPRREAFAGQAGALASLVKTVAPGLSDAVVRTAIRLFELREGDAPPTQGNVFRPISDQWTVSGGWSNGPMRKLALPAALAAGAAGLALRWRKRKRDGR
jgi:short-subunit dehydrogenase